MTVSTAQGLRHAGLGDLPTAARPAAAARVRVSLAAQHPPASLPGPPHLLVPVLAVLIHLRLEDGLLALGALGQEQQAVRLVEGQVGRGHPPFAARRRGRKSG